MAQCQEFRSLDLSTDDGSASRAARSGLDDLRSALSWAFESPGCALARDLVFAALPRLTHLGLTYEFKTWIVRALEAETDPRGRLALSIGLGKAAHLLQSEPVTQTELYNGAYELAKQLGDVSGALQALWGVATIGQATHRPQLMLNAAKQFYDFAVVNDRLSDSFVAECLVAFGLHDLGAFGAAQDHLLHVLAHYPRSNSVLDTQQYLFNYRALALSWLASAEWRTGRGHEAAKTIGLAVAEAGDHVPSMFVALSHFACPIALDQCDWATATLHIDEIYRQCGHHVRWRRWADALSAILAFRTDRSLKALDRLDGLLGERGNQFPGQHFWYWLELIKGHVEFGNWDRARSLAVLLIQALREREEYWLLPDIICVKGTIDAELDPTGADANFIEALELSSRQGALISEVLVTVDRAAGATRRAPEGTVETTAKSAFRKQRLGPEIRRRDSWSSKLVAYSAPSMSSAAAEPAAPRTSRLET
jgi:hypothetical protein